MKYHCLLTFFFISVASITQGQTPIPEILKELGELPEVSLQVENSKVANLVSKTEAPQETTTEIVSQSAEDVTDSHQIYRTKKGDNPWTIARRFKVDYEEFLEFNNIKNPRSLKVGQELKIPKAINSNQPKTESKASPYTATDDFYYYTMRPGEDPWIISRRLKVDYKELLKYNNISNPRAIKTGRKLKVPK